MLDVIWSAEKCADPRGCSKCLNACPNGVLSMFGAGRQPGVRETRWTISPTFLASCDGCGICAQSCPSNAIQVCS